MATYTELHQSEIGQHSQDISSSAILDHGSISFGRFAAESLAWEKWSVFRHNRCQEELEMYKANGLVAQKKAYFEEYYKRVRALKALQSEQRETVQTDTCPDVRISTTQLEHGNSDNDLSKQEKLGPDTVPISDSSPGSVVDKSEEADQESLNDCNGNSYKFTVTNETSNILSTVEPEHSTHEASVAATLPVARGSGFAKHDSHVSDPVKHNANERKKHATVLNAKGNSASARNKSKLDCSITKSAVKASEKSKSLPLNQITGKRDNILFPSKSSTRIASSGKNSNQLSPSHKKLTEVRSSATVLHPSSTRNRMVPSSPSGRSDQRKANTNGKDLADSLRPSRPIHARAVQNPKREKPITSGLKDKALEKRTCPGVSRKPSELSSQQMRPKVCQSENQRPNSMLTDLARNKLIRNTEAERKEKEGGEGSNTTTSRRDPKSAYNPASSIQKNLKLVHKTAELRSGGRKHTQREPRHNTSIYLPSNAPLFSFSPLSGKEESSIICRRDPKPVSTVASCIEKNSKPLHKTESRSGGLKHALKATKI